MLGNLTKKSKGTNDETWTFGWDNRNRVTWIERRATDGGTLEMRADYTTDAFGNRIEKVVDADGAGSGSSLTTRFALDGWNPAKSDPCGLENFDIFAELDNSNAQTAHYLHGDAVDQFFAHLGANTSNTLWYLPDRLGSIRDLADTNGDPTNHITYTGFGAIVSESSPIPSNRIFYTGRELDPESGLQHNRSRYYDPLIGRWISEDPIGFTAGDTTLYRYIGNNATNGTDPSGLELLAWGDKAKAYATGRLRCFGVNFDVVPLPGLSRLVATGSTVDETETVYLIAPNGSMANQRRQLKGVPIGLDEGLLNSMDGSGTNNVLYYGKKLPGTQFSGPILTWYNPKTELSGLQQNEIANHYLDRGYSPEDAASFSGLSVEALNPTLEQDLKTLLTSLREVQQLLLNMQAEENSFERKFISRNLIRPDLEKQPANPERLRRTDYSFLGASEKSREINEALVILSVNIDAIEEELGDARAITRLKDSKKTQTPCPVAGFFLGMLVSSSDMLCTVVPILPNPIHALVDEDPLYLIPGYTPYSMAKGMYDNYEGYKKHGESSLSAGALTTFQATPIIGQGIRGAEVVDGRSYQGVDLGRELNSAERGYRAGSVTVEVGVLLASSFSGLRAIHVMSSMRNSRGWKLIQKLWVDKRGSLESPSMKRLQQRLNPQTEHQLGPREINKTPLQEKALPALEDVKAGAKQPELLTLGQCFPPDTLVDTERGLRPIGEIERGDRVWGYDFICGQWRLCEVQRRFDAEYEGPIVTIDVGIGEANSTAYHPFWVVSGEDLETRPKPGHVEIFEDRGGVLPGRWVNSHDIRVGDTIVLRGQGLTTVRRVHQREEITPVCNLTVQDLHTFAVGPARILVHNTSASDIAVEIAKLKKIADDPGHHPRARLAAKEMIEELSKRNAVTTQVVNPQGAPMGGPKGGKYTVYHGTTEAGAENLVTKGIDSKLLGNRDEFQMAIDPKKATNFGAGAVKDAVGGTVKLVRFEIPEDLFNVLYNDGHIKAGTTSNSVVLDRVAQAAINKAMGK